LNASREDSLWQGLRQLGYVDGKNIIMEYRYADGQLDRLPQLAAELIELKVDLIIVSGTRAAVAAKQATSTIPIVLAGVGDPVQAGLINSLSHPGGNVTGVSRLSPDFIGKRVELIKEVIPKARHIAALSNPDNPAYGEFERNRHEGTGIGNQASDRDGTQSGGIRKRLWCRDQRAFRCSVGDARRPLSQLSVSDYRTGSQEPPAGDV